MIHKTSNIREILCAIEIQSIIRKYYEQLYTNKIGNLSILKEINAKYSLEGLMTEAPILWTRDVKSLMSPDVTHWKSP